MTGRLKLFVVVVLLSVYLVPETAAQDADGRIRQLDAEARREEQQGHPDVAIQKYQEILKLNPKLPIAYNNLGRLYYQQNQFNEAIEALNHAAELAPSLEAPRAQLGFCFYQMGDFARARQEFGAAAKLNPQDGLAKLFLARSLLELGDVKGAQKLLEQLQQADPKNVEVLFSLGWAYMSLAVSNLTAIQKVDPNSYLTEFLQGKYAESKQAYPEAAEHYKKAVDRAPDQPEVRYCYAHSLYSSGDFAPALKEYQHVLEMSPYDFRAYGDAARIVLSDNPQEAYRLANRALEIKPGTYGALVIRGRALLALGKPADAVKDFKQAGAINPQDSAIHFQLARAYTKLGMTQEAKEETAIYERIEHEAHFPSSSTTETAPR